MQRIRLHHAFRLTAVATVLSITACSPPLPTCSGYPPISKEMLIDAEYSHRTGGEDWELTWTFSETEFVITATDDFLPPDLVETVTGNQQQTKQLNGTWDLQDEVLLISNVMIDNETEVIGERSARIFPTGVIRIQTSGAQYVFSPSRSKSK
jgi:hypothetical protein